MNTLIAQIQSILTTTPERWQRLSSTLSIELFTRPAAPGEWSALNCLQHLLVAERWLYPVRIREFLAGQNFSDFDPGQPHADIEAMTPEQLVTAFTQQRQENLALLNQITDDDLARTVQHPRLGTVTLAQMLPSWAAHDLNHTIQAERALMQPFIRACGPWSVFFRDHDANVE